jgi:putative Mg2+ transporter-C (MgtC) family protein
MVEVLGRIQALAAREGLLIANVFHAGDGNLHPTILYDARHPGLTERVVDAGAAILRYCVDAGGTLSGEHGIGLEKEAYLDWVLGPADQAAQLAVRLLVAGALGGLLGWERGRVGKAAGLRTHILVTLGAAAYTIAGTYGIAGLGTVQDPGRVAAQIVTGVGFLGAGTIWRHSQPDGQGVIYGLTTAASIWVAAAVGMACGFGLYFLGAACAVLGFLVLRADDPLDRALRSWFRRPTPKGRPLPPGRRRRLPRGERGGPSAGTAGDTPGARAPAEVDGRGPAGPEQGSSQG